MARAGIFYFDSAQGKRVFRLLADSEKYSRKERAWKKQALTKKPLSAKKPAPAKNKMPASNKMPAPAKMPASNKMLAPAKMPASMASKPSVDWKTTRLAAMTKTHRSRALQKINRRWKLDVYKLHKKSQLASLFRSALLGWQSNVCSTKKKVLCRLKTIQRRSNDAKKSVFASSRSRVPKVEKTLRFYFKVAWMEHFR